MQPSRARYIEALESRTLFAGSAIQLHGHTLVIRGDKVVGNSIEVTVPDGKDLLTTIAPLGIAPQTREFAFSSVRRIRVTGGPKGDWIQIGDANQPISLPTTISGGAGNDTIVGGAGRDHIICGSGKNLIDGQSSRDAIVGGSGYDIVRYYAGDRTHLRPGHGEVIDATVVPDQSSTQFLTPAQVRQAYGVDAISFSGIAGDGFGETIAIIGRFNNPAAQIDLQQFDAHFGLPSPPSFQVLNQEGMTAPLPPDATVGAPHNGAIEESIDVQWAHAIAPHASIVLVEADTDSAPDIAKAITTAAALPGVVAVSMSFGSQEFPGETMPSDTTPVLNDSLFQTPMGHPGVTFLAASGDNARPLYPASSPNVVAVGGSVLSVFADGTYLAESAWSNSGGGTSAIETDAFQTGETVPRTTPDVAMDATRLFIVDSYDFPDAPIRHVFGTSIACPMWAGLIAIADQGRALAGLPSLDGRTQTLPALYSSILDKDYNPIPSVDNGSLNMGKYSIFTGRGTPIANRLVPDLAAYRG